MTGDGTLPAPLVVGPYDVVDYLRFAAAYWDFGIGGHYDAQWARSKGFDAPYAQGYLLWATTIWWMQAWLERRQEEDLRLHRVRLRFTSPIYAAEKFELSATATPQPFIYNVAWRPYGANGQLLEAKAHGECELVGRSVIEAS
jgi:hypothetical protein